MFLGRHKTTVILVTLMCVVGGAASFFVMPHQRKFNAVKEQLRERELILAAKKAECVMLNKAVYDLQYTPSAVERVAREKYKLCREGEQVYEY